MSLTIFKSVAHTDPWENGYDAYNNRFPKGGNPYDKAIKPNSYQQWYEGWIAAETDHMNQIELYDLIGY